MMTMIIDHLIALGDDVEFFSSGKLVFATLQDFAGFDDRWREIEREYDDADAVDAFIEWCNTTADSYTDDIITEYHFGDVVLWLGYASADI